MPNRPRFLSYLGTTEGKISLSLVIACGLAMVFFIGRTYLEPAPRTYALDFGQAQWIEAAKPSPCNYFRKDIYLPSAVDQAWIQIASTDNYTLYVNGERVDERNFYGITIAGLYDLKSLLRPGKNAIAISVLRVSLPGSAQLRVRGFYVPRGGSPPQEFDSDSTWRASNTPDGVVGGYAWHTRELDDTFWSFAKAASAEGRFPVTEWVNFDPRLLETKPSAKWIGPAESTSYQASFSGNLNVPSKRRETWLQIAATGDYDLMINGRPIVTRPFTTQVTRPPTATQTYASQLSVNTIVTQPFAKQLKNRPVSPQVFSTKPVLLAYEISRWLRNGNNLIVIRVRSQTQPAMLLAEGYTVTGKGDLQRFGTDDSWNAFLYADKKERAVVCSAYGQSPWGNLEQKLATPEVTPIYDLQTVLSWGSLAVVVESSLLLAWVVFGRFSGALIRHPAERLWTFDGIFHLCVLAVILACWLLTFDVRFPNNWCFQPKFILGCVLLLLVGKLLLFFPRGKLPSISEPTKEAEGQPGQGFGALWWLRRYGKVVALGSVVLLGLGLRLHDLTKMSLDVDETGVTQFSHGVQKRGYPFIQLGPYEREVTTYELVSYSIAAARQFLGESEGAYRTPSVIFGTLTVLLIGVAGWRMMGWGVGLVSALIYATFPAGLFWGRNAFWPSQEQFFALLSIWCFYEAVRTNPLRRGFLTAASIAFTLAYLTWEGSGFLLPVLFLCMFVLKWGEYEWMKDWHLWRCCFYMSFVVLIQLTHRQVASLPTYLQTGNNLSEVTSPELVPLDLTKFNPFYYIYWLLFAENYCVMSLVGLLGIVFCWRYRPIRYLFVLTAGLMICYTEFLPAYAVRYCYGYQAVLILVSVGILFKLLEMVCSLRHYKLRWCVAAALLALFILSANSFVLKTYRLSTNPTEPFYGERLGLYRADSRSPAKFIAENVRPGDCVIISVPHMFEFYSHMKGNYSINTMLDNKITYDATQPVPHFIDKFRGYPCIRGIEELEDLRARYKRIWVERLGGNHTNPAVEDYFLKNSRIAFQSYRSQVNLLDGARDLTEQAVVH
jgi:hypothetical protein